MRKAVINPTLLWRYFEYLLVAAIGNRKTFYLVSQVIFKKNVARQSQLIQVLCRADGLFPPVRISLEEVERMKYKYKTKYKRTTQSTAFSLPPDLINELEKIPLGVGREYRSRSELMSSLLWDFVNKYKAKAQSDKAVTV